MEKKKNLLLKKLAVMFAAAFLVVQLVSCGDDDPLKGGKPGGTDTPIPGKVDDLKNAEKSIINQSFTYADLNSLDSNAALGTKLQALDAGVIINTDSGRSKTATRLVVVIAQDMFGNDISAAVSAATKDLAKKHNLVFVIGGKPNDDTTKAPDRFKTHLDSAKIKSNPNADSTLGGITPAVTSYATLQAAASKLLVGARSGTARAYTYSVKFGKLVYDDTTDLYANARAKLVDIIVSLGSVANQMQANSEDIALVAFDPFMSTLVVDLAGDTANVNKTGHKIKTVAALAPIMKFSSEGTSTAANISYPDAGNILKVASDSLAQYMDNATDTSAAKVKLQDAIATKQAFNALRTSGGADKTKSFFASLVNGVATHDLTAKTSSKIKDVVFHIAGTEKSATATAPNIAGIGGNLILQDNADNANAGLKAIVDPATNVTVTTLALTDMGTVDADANFPTKDKVTNLFTKAPFKEALKAD